MDRRGCGRVRRVRTSEMSVVVVVQQTSGGSRLGSTAAATPSGAAEVMLALGLDSGSGEVVRGRRVVMRVLLGGKKDRIGSTVVLVERTQRIVATATAADFVPDLLRDRLGALHAQHSSIVRLGGAPATRLVLVLCVFVCMYEICSMNVMMVSCTDHTNTQINEREMRTPEMILPKRKNRKERNNISWVLVMISK